MEGIRNERHSVCKLRAGRRIVAGGERRLYRSGSEQCVRDLAGDSSGDYRNGLLLISRLATPCTLPDLPAQEKQLVAFHVAAQLVRPCFMATTNWAVRIGRESGYRKSRVVDN